MNSPNFANNLTFGANTLTHILSEEVYARLNQMVIERIGAMNMEYLLNSETPDSWKVIFIQGNMSNQRHSILFIRVEGK